MTINRMTINKNTKNKNTKFSDDTIRLICLYRIESMKLKDISSALDISISTICQILNKRYDCYNQIVNQYPELDRIEKNLTNRKYTKDQIETLVKNHDLSLRKLEKITGINISTISQIFNGRIKIYNPWIEEFKKRYNVDTLIKPRCKYTKEQIKFIHNNRFKMSIANMSKATGVKRPMVYYILESDKGYKDLIDEIRKEGDDINASRQ